MPKNDMQKVVHGAFILSVASFVAKLLSAVYRVPFQNIVGDEGFYAYQQVYPIYGVGMTLALSGLPIFLSKMVAGQSANNTKKLLRQFYPVVVSFSLLLFFFIFFGSDWLAKLMGDPHLATMMRVIAILFLLVPGLAFRRGYFQGQLWMVPTALSQVVEQIVRITVILIAAWQFNRLNWSIYEMGAVAMSGAVFGGVSAYAILLFYQRKQPKPLLDNFEQPDFQLPWQTVWKSCFFEGGLICLYSAYLVIYQLLDSFTVKKALLDMGMSETAARISKGVYDRGQPLVQLGLVISLALASTFLPVLTKYHKQQEQKKFEETAATFVKMTALLSLAATAGLISLLPLVNFALFEDTNGQVALAVFVGSIAVMALITVCQSIYQSLDRIRMPAISALSGLLIKLFVNRAFTRSFGTVGSSMGTILGLIICLLLLWSGLPKALRRSWLSNGFGWKVCLTISLLATALLAYMCGFNELFGMPESRFLALLRACGGVLVGVVVVIFSILKIRLFTAKEWSALPFGLWLTKHYQKNNKL